MHRPQPTDPPTPSPLPTEPSDETPIGDPPANPTTAPPIQDPKPGREAA